MCYPPEYPVAPARPVVSHGAKARARLQQPDRTSPFLAYEFGYMFGNSCQINFGKIGKSDDREVSSMYRVKIASKPRNEPSWLCTVRPSFCVISQANPYGCALPFLERQE